MNDHTFLNLQITRSDNWPHVKCDVDLVIAYGQSNFPQGLCGYDYEKEDTVRFHIIGIVSTLVDFFVLNFCLLHKW